MNFALRTTDLSLGYSVVPRSQLLVVNFSPKEYQSKSYAGVCYPHVSFYCSTLTSIYRAFGEEIIAQFDSFHISFSEHVKTWKLVTAATGDGAGSKLLITDDNSKESATLGATALVGKGVVWGPDDICNKFLLPLLNLRVKA